MKCSINFDSVYDHVQRLLLNLIILETNWLIPQLTDTLTTYEQLNFGAVGNLGDKKSFYEDEKVSFLLVQKQKKLFWKAEESTTPEGMVAEAARKREHRLIKNREAARECRRKKKEYIKVNGPMLGLQIMR